jgi:hypothetical protein
MTSMPKLSLPYRLGNQFACKLQMVGNRQLLPKRMLLALMMSNTVIWLFVVTGHIFVRTGVVEFPTLQLILAHLPLILT